MRGIIEIVRNTETRNKVEGLASAWSLDIRRGVDFHGWISLSVIATVARVPAMHRGHNRRSQEEQPVGIPRQFLKQNTKNTRGLNVPFESSEDCSSGACSAWTPVLVAAIVAEERCHCDPARKPEDHGHDFDG